MNRFHCSNGLAQHSKATQCRSDLWATFAVHRLLEQKTVSFFSAILRREMRQMVFGRDLTGGLPHVIQELSYEAVGLTPYTPRIDTDLDEGSRRVCFKSATGRCKSIGISHFAQPVYFQHDCCTVTEATRNLELCVYIHCFTCLILQRSGHQRDSDQIWVGTTWV